MDPKPRPLLIRILLTLVGAFLVLLGLIGLFVPVMPGWLLVVPGLAILAGEFVWARRLLDGARTQLDRARGISRKDEDQQAA